MRTLKNVVRFFLWVVLIVVILGGVFVPGIYVYTVATLPVQIDTAYDIELQLRQIIESDRQSLQMPRPVEMRESVAWPRPDFSKIPKHLIALHITGTGCPEYFRSPPERGWPWLRRLSASLRDRILDGDGACELIYARSLGRRLSIKSDLQLAVVADRIHRLLGKDELVAFDLESVRFEQGLVGLDKAAQVLAQKPLQQLNLAELAELQLAMPPWGYWDELRYCRNPPLIKESRDALRRQLATFGHISEEMARSSSSQEVRCLAVKH